MNQLFEEIEFKNGTHPLQTGEPYEIDSSGDLIAAIVGMGIPMVVFVVVMVLILIGGSK
jgi:hypothetical protein